MRNGSFVSRIGLAAILSASAVAGIVTPLPARTTGDSADFEKALELFRKASKGYVPEGEKHGRKLVFGTGEKKETVRLPDLDGYRLATLRKAVPALEKAIEREGAHRQTAYRMLALIREAEGQRRVARAFSRWGELEMELVRVFGKATAVSAIAARIDQIKVRESGATANAIREQRKKLDQRLGERRRRLAEIRRRADAIRKELSSWREKQQSASAAAQRFESGSFDSEKRSLAALRKRVKGLLAERGWSSEQRKLLDSVGAGTRSRGEYLMDLCAVLLRRKASRAATRMRITETKLDRIEGRISVIEARLAVDKRTIEELEKSAEAARDVQGTLREGRGKAEKRMKETLDELRERFKGVLETFQKAVYRPVALEAAGIGDRPEANYRRAVRHIRDAREAAKGESRRLRAAELTARMRRVRAIADLTGAVDEVHGTVAMIADRMVKTLGEKEAALFTRKREALKQRLVGVAAAGSTAVGNAQSLVDGLADGDREGPFVEMAERYGRELNRYRGRLSTFAQ